MAPTSQQLKSLKASKLVISSGGGKKKKSKSSSSKAAGSNKARVQRYLKSVEPKLNENPNKNVLLFKGIKTSAGINALLRELRAVSAPHSKLLAKKNQIVAFDNDGIRSIEFLTTKNDCALFAMGCHNKKRPNRLVIGRTFDHQVLDMVELGVRRFKSMMQDYSGQIPKKRIGSKPLLLFVGDVWSNTPDYRQLQNLLVDFYRGDVIDKLVLNGIDHLMVFTAATATDDGTTNPNISNNNNNIMIHQRTYFCKLKKNPNPDNNSPLPYLEPCGPDLDFVLQRSQWCSDKDMYKASRMQPSSTSKKSSKKSKKKNQSTNVFGETLGRLHIAKQNVGDSMGKKSKALRRAEQIDKAEERQAIDQDLRKEQDEW